MNELRAALEKNANDTRTFQTHLEPILREGTREDFDEFLETVLDAVTDDTPLTNLMRAADFKSKSVGGENAPYVTYRIGKVFLDRIGNEDMAEMYFRKLPADSEFMAELHDFYVDFYLRKENWRKLEQLFLGEAQAAGTENPVVESKRRTARLARKQGKPDRALAYWQGLRRELPGDPEVQQELLDLYRETGKWHQVADVLKARADGLPDDEADAKVALYKELIGLYRDKLKMEAKVAATYQAILKLVPDDAEAFDSLCGQYKTTNRWPDLVKLLKARIEASDPDDAFDLHRQVADIMEERFNNVTEAMRAYEAMRDLRPDDVDVIKKLKELYQARRDWTKYVEVAKAELSFLEGEERFETLRELARLSLQNVRDASLGVSLWKEVKDADPQDGEAFDALMHLYERGKNFEGVAELLEERIDQVSQDDQRALLERLAVIYGSRIQDMEQAAESWKRLLQLDGENHRAKAELKKILVRSKDVENLDWFFRSYSTLNDYARTLDSMAKDEEEPILKVQVLFRLADLYGEESGKEDRARGALERILEADAQNIEAADKLLPVYRHLGKWSELVQIQDLILSERADMEAEEKLELLLAKAEIHEEKLSELEDAFFTYVAAYQEAWTRADIREHLERLAAASNNWETYMSVLEGTLELYDLETEKIPFLMRIAEIWETELSAPDSSIEYLSRVLEIDETFVDAMAALERLYQQTSKWQDLKGIIGHRLEAESDAAERQRLLLALGAVCLDELDDPGGAIEAFNTLVGEFPDMSEAYDRLAQVMLKEDRNDDLLELLETKLAALAPEGMALADLMLDIGMLYYGVHDDVATAADRYIEALRVEAEHPRAISLLEELVGSEEVQHRVSVALESVYEDRGDLERLADSLEIQLKWSDDVDQVRLLERLRDLYLDAENLESAGVTLRRLVALAPDEPEHQKRLEGIAAQLDDWFPVVSLYAEIVGQIADEAHRHDVMRSAADIYHRRIGDRELAKQLHRTVLEEAPGDQQALTSLQDIATEEEDWDGLLEIFETRKDLEHDTGARIAIMRDSASVCMDRLGDLERATGTVEEILELDPSNLETLDLLDQLYTRQEKWGELMGALEQMASLAASPEVETGTLLRMAELYEQKLDDPAGMVEKLERVLVVDPENELAIEILDRNVQGDLALAVLDLLEAYMRRTSRFERLVDLLSIRKTFVEEDYLQVDIQKEIGRIYDEDLELPEESFETYRVALGMMPEDEETLGHLMVLSNVLGNFQQLFLVLDEETSNMEDCSQRVEMWRIMATLSRDKLGEPGTAVEFFRRVMDAEPDDPDAITSLGALYREGEQWDKLVDVLEVNVGLVDDLEERKSMLMELGAIHYGYLEQAEQAIQAYEEILQLDQDDVTALTNLENLYTDTSKWDELEQILQRRAMNAMDEDEKRALMLRRSEVLDLSLERYDDAYQVLEELFSYAREDLDVIQRMETLLEKREDWISLLDILRHKLELAEGDGRVPILMKTASVYADQLEDVHQAVTTYGAVLEQYPSVTTVLDELEQIVLTMEEKEEAYNLLKPRLVEHEEWERLLVCMEAYKESLDDLERKIDLLLEMAELADEKNADLGRAFHLAAQALTLVPHRLDIADLLEQIGHRADMLEQVIDAYADTAAAAEMEDDAVAIMLRKAELLKDELRDYDRAIEEYEKLRELRQEKRILEALDELHTSAQNWAELGAILREEIESVHTPDEKLAYFYRLAELQEDRLGDAAGACEVIKEAYLMDGENVETLARLRRLYDEAVADAEAGEMLETYYSSHEQWQQVAEVLERRFSLAEDRDDRLEVCQKLISVYLDKLGNEWKGLKFCGESLVIDPEDESALFQLQQLMEQTGEVGDTINFLQRARAETDSTEPFRNLSMETGKLLQKMERFDEAEVVFKEIFEKDDEFQPAWEALEDLYETQARHQEHEGVLQRLIELVEYEDERIPLLLKLGRLRRDILDSPAEATASFASVLEIDDRNQEALTSLAALYEASEQFDKLVEVLTNVVEQTQDDGERVALLQKLAYLHEEQLEDVESAISSWCDVLDWTPNDSGVLANLQRLYKREEQWQDFVDMAERETRLDDVPADRLVELYRDVARAAGGELDDPTLAQQNWEAVAERVVGDTEANDCLRSLYRTNEDFMKLAQLLEGLASDEALSADERVASLTELGRVKMEEIMDLEGAITAWREVVVLDSLNLDAFDALEQLYADTARFEDCVNLLLEKLTLLEEDFDRIALLDRVASLQEESMNDWRSAAETRLRIISLDATAIEQYDRVATLYEDHEEWEALAGLLVRRLEVEDDETEKVAVFTRVAQINEENLGNDSGALEAVKNALVLDPGSMDLVEMGERIAQRSSLWQDLYEIWSASVSHLDEDAQMDAMLKLGALLRDRLENPGEAVEWYEKVLELAPEDETSLTALVALYEETSNWSNLAGALEQLAQVVPDFNKQIEYSLQLGDTLARQLDEQDRATEAYRQVLELDPTEERAVDSLQALYTEAERWEDLIGVLAMRASLHPQEDTELKLISGELYEEQLEEPLKAAELYEELVTYDPSATEAFERLERIYTEHEIWDRLVETYEKVLSVTVEEGSRLEILKKLALLNESVLDDSESAADYYQQILDLQPEDRDTIASLERLYDDQERYDDLVLVLRRAVQLAETIPEKVSYLDKCAELYSGRLDDLTSAIVCYKEILEFDPAHLETLTRLEHLFGEEGDFMEVQTILDQRIQMARDNEEIVELYLKKGDIYKDELLMPDRAREQYHMALERDPNFVDATSRLIEIYSEEENWEKIIDMQLARARAADTEEQRAEIFALMGGYMRDKMDNEEGAIEVYEAALERVPELPAALNPLAEIYMDREQWEKAFPLLEMVRTRIEEEDASSEELGDLYCKLAKASMSIGKRDEALDYYRRAYDRNPDDLATLEGLARLNLEQGNYEVAEAYFSNLVDRGEDAFEVNHLVSILRSLGEIEMNMGHPDKAREHLGRVLELQPNDLGCIEDLAQLMEGHNDWEGAIRYRRQLVDLIDDDLERWQVLIAIGDTYREKLDDLDSAIEAYNEALMAQPHSKNALVKLLEIHINAKAYSEAINILQHLIQVEENPQRKASYTFSIATIYRQELEEPEMSVDYYEQTLDLNSDKLEAFRAVDEVLTTLRDWDALEGAYRRMIARVRGKSVEKLEFKLYSGLGEIYRSRLQQLEMAASSFELAAKIKPDATKVREILAQLYETLGQKEKSVAEHRALVTLEPDRVESYRMMASIFRDMGLVDDAWFCLAVLAMGKKLNDEERDFYEGLRPAGLVAPGRGLDSALWMKGIFSKAEEFRVGEVFQTLYQAIGPYLEGRDAKELGLKKRDELDLRERTVFTDVLQRVSNLLGIPAPKVYLSDRSFGMRIEATIPPVLVIGKDMLHGKTEKELGFIIAKNLTYFHPMHILAACYPAAVLKLLYRVAIKFVHADASVEGADTEQFQQMQANLTKRISPQLANALTGSIDHYFKKDRSPSISKWLTGVELTANHAGLLASMDLQVASSVLRQESIAFSKLPPKEKAKELVLYAISEQFAEARSALSLVLEK